MKQKVIKSNRLPLESHAYIISWNLQELKKLESCYLKPFLLLFYVTKYQIFIPEFRGYIRVSNSLGRVSDADPTVGWISGKESH